jgi:hypothetical protein
LRSLRQRQRRNDFGDEICAHVILPRCGLRAARSPVIEYPAPPRGAIVVHVRNGDAGKIAIAAEKT